VSTRPSGKRVIVVLQGGIGNQLFQLCAGEAILKKTGRPVFYDCELGFRGDSFGRQFELEHLVPAGRRTASPSGTGMWRTSLQERLEVTLEQAIMFKRGICSLPLKATMAMVGWWPASEVVFRSSFQSLEYVETEIVDRIRKAIHVGASEGTHEVAVHFRLTRDQNRDGRTVSEYSETVLGLGYYREALRKVRGALGPVCFRVFCDTGSIPENVFAPEDTVVLDRPFQNESARLTLGRMARCSHFVIANSTFSWWAAYLGRVEGKLVYAPKEWRFSRRAAIQRGIFPAEWRRT
jgi:hypothetical protein